MKSAVVSAVGVIVTQGGDATPLSQRLEEAMSQAVHTAIAEGVSVNDTEQLKARMQSAREEVLKSVGLLVD